MIYDTVDNLELYCAVSPRLRKAIEVVRRFDTSRPDGRYDLDDERMYALIATYETKGMAEVQFESHRKYADVQIILDGREFVDVSVGEKLEAKGPYSEQQDTALWEAPEQYCSLSMRPGRFAVFFPHDIHRPGRRIKGGQRVRKLVVKVEI